MTSDRDDLYVGFLSSLIGHALLVVIVLGAVAPRFDDLVKPVIYSVTLEGGPKLGGISQVPKDDKSQQMAPPKRVAEKEKAETLEREKAEVSLAEEKAKKESLELKLKEEEKKKREEEKKKKEAELKKKAEEKKKQEELKKKQEQEKKKAAPKQTQADIDKRLNAAMQRYLGESTDAGGQGFGAGALGKKGMGGGVLRPPAFFFYRDLLKSHIRKGWSWYDTSAALIAVVKFKIEADGSLRDIELLQGSGNSQFDSSVMRAIYAASPVPPPPTEVYEAFFREVTMRFDPRE